jgi:hypothetical protein
MNDGDHAPVRRKLQPIDIVSFKRIDGDGDVGIFPGFVEFGRLRNDVTQKTSSNPTADSDTPIRVMENSDKSLCG